MNANDIEEAAGAQIALTVAIEAPCSPCTAGPPWWGKRWNRCMEMARAGLFASPNEERKLQAFEDVAEILVAAFTSPP